MNIVLVSSIPDLKIIQPNIHRDDRGFFVERFNKKVFADLGLPTEYFQLKELLL